MSDISGLGSQERLPLWEGLLGSASAPNQMHQTDMTVIPPERGGMAAGIGGTIRFAGIVIGFAGFGAILYERVTTTLTDRLPNLAFADHARIVREIVAGDLAKAAIDQHGPAAYASFAAGYQAVFIAAAVLTLVHALATFVLIRANDTPPTPISNTMVASE